MRFRDYFFTEDDSDSGDNDNNDDSASLAKNKSTTMPPKSCNTNLENYLNIISNQQIYTNKKANYNISVKEKNAIETLRNDSDIIIKEADKGGSVIIVDKDYYKEKILEMLLI